MTLEDTEENRVLFRKMVEEAPSHVHYCVHFEGEHDEERPTIWDREPAFWERIIGWIKR